MHNLREEKREEVKSQKFMSDEEESLSEPKSQTSRGLRSVEERVAQEGEWDDLLTDVEETFRREAIIQAIEMLSDKQKTVLHLRFGLCFQQDEEGNWLYPQGPQYKSLIDNAVGDGRLDSGVWERAITRSSRQEPPFFLTLREVSKVLGVTNPRIGAIEKEALKVLRKKSRELLEYY